MQLWEFPAFVSRILQPNLVFHLYSFVKLIFTTLQSNTVSSCFNSTWTERVSAVLFLRRKVPELSFLLASYRGWTRAGKKRVQDNLHAHAQNAAISSPPNPNQGKNHIWNYLPDSIFWIIIYKRQFLHKNMSINPKSVEFHQCHQR